MKTENPSIFGSSVVNVKRKAAFLELLNILMSISYLIFLDSVVLNNLSTSSGQSF
jgi:hypothetical protein